MKIRHLIAATVARITRSASVEAPVYIGRHRAPELVAAPIPAPKLAEDVKGTVPEVEAIEAAARAYDQARLDTNTAARAKNKAVKVLDRTPDGQYGSVLVERFASTRQVADLEAIRAIFEANGLGEVPMKGCAASLSLTFAAEAEVSHDEQQLVAA